METTYPSQTRYRELQASTLKQIGKAGAFMHEHGDMHDPHTEKEDCELNAFLRLSQRIKQRFARMPFCIVGDALFCASCALDRCAEYGWKYVLTVKEGRQPNLWEELLALLPLSRTNSLRLWNGQNGQDGLRDYRWVSHLPLGSHSVSAALVGEMVPGGESTLYAYVTNFFITADRVVGIIGTAGGGSRWLTRPRRSRKVTPAHSGVS